MLRLTRLWCGGAAGRGNDVGGAARKKKGDPVPRGALIKEQGPGRVGSRWSFVVCAIKHYTRRHGIKRTHTHTHTMRSFCVSSTLGGKEGQKKARKQSIKGTRVKGG